jgi:hypothetical protein
MLAAAKGGKTSFHADVYDGSEKGEKIYNTASTIGARLPPGGNRDLRSVKNAERLEQLPAWPISVAYYEVGSERKDALPLYELRSVFFENGVNGELYIDYGEFAIRGELKEIIFHETPKCERDVR